MNKSPLNMNNNSLEGYEEISSLVSGSNISSSKLTNESVWLLHSSHKVTTTTSSVLNNLTNTLLSSTIKQITNIDSDMLKNDNSSGEVGNSNNKSSIFSNKNSGIPGKGTLLNYSKLPSVGENITAFGYTTRDLRFQQSTLNEETVRLLTERDVAMFSDNITLNRDCNLTLINGNVTTNCLSIVGNDSEWIKPLLNVTGASNTPHCVYNTNLNSSLNSTDCFSSIPRIQITILDIFIAIFLSAFIISIIIGNILVVSSVVLFRDMRTLTNALIVSLAIADLLVAIIVLPISLHHEIVDHVWTLGPILCNFWITADVFCCTASILNIVVIAMDRYWLITMNVRYTHSPRFPRKKVCAVMITLAWGLSLIISTSPLLGWNSGHEKQPGKCVISQDLGYTLFSTFGAFWFPLSVILITYFQIFKYARKRERKREKSRSICPSVSTVASEFPSNINSSIKGARDSSLNYGSGGNNVTESSNRIRYDTNTCLLEENEDVEIEENEVVNDEKVADSCGENRRNSSILQQIEEGKEGGIGQEVLTDEEDKDNLTKTETITCNETKTRSDTYMETCINSPVHSNVNLTSMADVDDGEKYCDREEGEESKMELTQPPECKLINGENRSPQPDNGGLIAGEGGGEDSSLLSKYVFPANNNSNHVVVNGKSNLDNDTTHVSNCNEIADNYNLDGLNSDDDGDNNQEQRNNNNDVNNTDNHSNNKRSSIRESISSVKYKSKRGSSLQGSGYFRGKTRRQFQRLAQCRSSRMRYRNRMRSSARTLGLIIGCFVMCWMPFFIIATIIPFCPICAEKVPGVVFSIGLWLGYSNSLLNPAIYAIWDKNFRRSFKKVLKCRINWSYVF